MANEFVGRRWIIDTVSATPLTTEKLFVKSIRWVRDTATAGDNVEIRDPAGKLLWETVAADQYPAESDLIEEWWEDGFAVPVFAGGRMIISLG